MKEKLKELYEKYKVIRDRVFEHASDPKKEITEYQEQNKKVFAQGCGFYKLFWIFVIGSFLGAVVEIVFVGLTSGNWMSRSSVIWGQFSIVWGSGCVLLSWVLHKWIKKDDRFIFVAGTILGGAFEYFCSWFTEKVFGCVFWDYSHMTFNINGRINLLFCFFWGIVALVWIKICYPWLSKLIERMPILVGKIATWFAILFFVINIMVTSAALYRMNLDRDDIAPRNWAERYVENHYSTEWLLNRYENLKVK